MGVSLPFTLLALHQEPGRPWEKGLSGRLSDTKTKTKLWPMPPALARGQAFPHVPQGMDTGPRMDEEESLSSCGLQPPLPIQGS